MWRKFIKDTVDSLKKARKRALKHAEVKSALPSIDDDALLKDTTSNDFPKENGPTIKVEKE